jgi:hypothetical protein
MTDRTWTGAVSNDASDPLNWSPSDSAPQPGDTLDAGAGTRNFMIDITGNALAGDTLTVHSGYTYPAPNTFNLSHNAQVNLDLSNSYASDNVAYVSGRDTLDVNLGVSNRLTINLAAHADLFGSFDATRYSELQISEAGNAKYHNDGTDTFSGATVVINARVVGSGMFFVSYGPDGSTGSLEFGGSVSSQQTVDLLGGAINPFYPARTSSLKVDAPSLFHATIDLHDYSLADFVGLAQADSWSYKNDLLTLKNAYGQVVDRFHIISDASSTGDVHGLSVSKSAAGDVLVSPGTGFSGSLVVPTS